MSRRFRQGLFVLLLLLAGCVISPRRDGTTGSGTGSGGGGGTTNPTGKLYVSDDSGNSILRFNNAFTATGNIAPAANISGAGTQLSSPQALALDQQSDRLFVADLNVGAVLVFDAISTKSASVSPTRIISGAATNLTTPTDLSLDRGRDVLYVVEGTDVLVFSPASSANGNVAPAHIISPNPAFNIGGIFVDAANNRMFLSDPSLGVNAINVFDGANTLNGNVAASRTISGASTQLSQPGSIIVDSAGRLIVSNFSPPRITVYSNAGAASGNVSPASMFTSSDMTSPNQITLNTGNGDLYVADAFGLKVLVFANGATVTGNVAATRNISGSSTQLLGGGSLAGPRGVALDTSR